MRLISQLLAHQDPNAPHTLLTRVVITFIIISASLIYAGFFGILAVVAGYLLGVELIGMAPVWLYVPMLLALITGLISGLRQTQEYWRDHGHG
ncbi:MAG: hypothetical protein V2J10_00030 [Wenzhouxiangella sp.]|jgi:hypothetical protein|nr:hypothetical protein [Wenzhouxiangella sp.]